MELEKQVCSLELAKKLKELGVKQESHFYWWSGGYNGADYVGSVSDHERWEGKLLSDETHSWTKTAAAFTVAELGQMLPGHIEVDGNWYCWKAARDSTLLEHFYLFYSQVNGHGEIFQQTKTEADTRAKLLIYLLDQNLVGLEAGMIGNQDFHR